MNDALIIALKIVFVLMVVLNFASILTWMERKQSALMQDRIGANRADIFGFRIMGLFHIIADSLKMFLKEEFTPKKGLGFIHTRSNDFCSDHRPQRRPSGSPCHDVVQHLGGVSGRRVFS